MSLLLLDRGVASRPPSTSQPCDEIVADTVNTAARVAWIARKRSCAFLCTEEFTSSLLSTSDVSSKIAMVPVCSTMLKGKQAEVSLYAPKVGCRRQSLEIATSTIYAVPHLVDRESHIASMVKFISSFFTNSNSAQQQQQQQQQQHQPEPGIMVIEGQVGIGKSSLLSYVHHKAIPDIGGAQSLLVRALPHSAPFSLCSQFLQKLLELDGEEEASTFSRLEVRLPFTLYSCLPQPYLLEFAGFLLAEPAETASEYSAAD